MIVTLIEKEQLKKEIKDELHLTEKEADEASEAIETIRCLIYDLKMNNFPDTNVPIIDKIINYIGR